MLNARHILTCFFWCFLSLYAQRALAGDCFNGDNLCTTPCPAENSCLYVGTGIGCPGDQICVPACKPSWCFCDSGGSGWACSYDCAGECYDWPEPTGPPTHTVTDLGTLGGFEGIAHAINNYGDVVGESGALDGTRHATLWSKGKIVELSDGSRSWAADINNHGQVLLQYLGRTFVWDQGELTEIEGMNHGNAINDAGQVVGYGLGSFLWEEGTLTELWETIGIFAHDINNLGQIAGSIAADGENHAGLWDGTEITDLGTLGGLYSFTESLNDLGQVLGKSERAPGGDRTFYFFLWDNGVMHDLVELTGREREYAYALNNCGEVLLPGTGRTDVGFLVYNHNDGMLRPVRGVFGPATGWWNFLAWDMNDRGEIVGFGVRTGPTDAVLIAPVTGDFDWDGDCDLRDFAEFAMRMTGPLPPAIPGCQKADMDRDADVDLKDYAQFHNALSGPK